METSVQSMSTIFRVIRIADEQEIQRLPDLITACVCWVKDPSKLRVEELTPGSNATIREVPRKECCQSLRSWLLTNKHFVAADERADMEQLIQEACGTR